MVKLDDENRQRLASSELCHQVRIISHFVVIGVLDERLAFKSAKAIEVIISVVERTSGGVQSFHSDGAAAGGLHCHFNGTMAVGFVTLISTVVVTVAQAHLFDALRIGTSEVNIFVKVGRASETRAPICWRIAIAAFLVAVVCAVAGIVASAGL
jgi:hypothetical protein